jgi:formylglycine-generating enzyme required for sulfatase activity
MPPSYSPSTGLFYIPSEERRMFRTNSPGFGAVRAFDPRTGEKVWEFKNDSYFDGVLTTASDVLFAGTRYLYALNARTGEFLWQTPLAGLSQSGPMSYSVDDKQYVAVTAGNTLFAFALRPDVTLAPASAAAPLVASASVNEGARSTAIDFVRIAPGSFQMGCSVGDSQCDADEKPSHRVAITRSFEIGKYEVTQEQWQAVMGTNPSPFKGDKLPVSSVNWNEAQEFLSRMNSHKDGYHYRLPTEAEWEYAARAGTTGAHAGNVDQMAWYDRNAGSQMHPVGQKQANAWGLYDMEGNVREWVQDWFGPYESNSSTDPVGPDTGNFHVLRGGSWSFGKSVSVSLRDVSPPQGKLYNFGFRCVREAIR